MSDTNHDQNQDSQKHKEKMQKQKEKIDAHIDTATIERGQVLLLTGNGKGKSSSAFGMVMRCLGYDYKVGIVQFIKGVQLSGEEIFIRNHIDKNQLPEVDFYQMGTGFTWNTQDKSSDIAAAKATWEQAARMLQDESLHLVILDELTYMIAFSYLDEQTIIDAIANRPPEQTVVVTGRGGGSKLRELADTVSEIKDIKHGYQAGLKARKGVDF